MTGRDLRSIYPWTFRVQQLERKLRDFNAYMVGLRRGQNQTRANIQIVDESGRAVKISPLAAWTMEQVLEYTRANNVPVHPLYAKGYASIGCQPCTRPIESGSACQPKLPSASRAGLGPGR